MNYLTAVDLMNLNEAKQVKWNFNVRRRFSWFVEYFQIAGTNKDVFRRVLDIDFAYSNMKKDADYNEFTDAEEEARSIEIVKEKTSKGFGFLHGLAKKSYEKSEKMLSVAKKVSRSAFREMSNPELKILFDEIALELLEYQPIIFFVFPVEKYLENLLKKEVKRIATEKGQQEKINDYIQIFSMPKKELVVAMEEKNLLEITIARKEGKEIKQMLRNHLKEFAWIPTDDPTGRPWAEHDLEKRIEVLLEMNPEEKLERMINGEKQRKQTFKKYVEELELDDKAVELVNAAREFVFLRNYRIESWIQANFLVRPFLEFIASKAGLSLDQLYTLSSEEISAFLEKGEIVPREEIEKRLKAYAYIKLNEKLEVFFGEEAQKQGHFHPKEKETAGEEIRGSTANKGKAIGTVKVIKELSEISKVEKGDILVASMTVPQYIPAMEKAAALVTDEGGITCHAAIVSRELDVPCIVGTGNATKLLKDGDMVEVDANQGTVRKLGKKN